MHTAVKPVSAGAGWTARHRAVLSGPSVQSTAKGVAVTTARASSKSLAVVNQYPQSYMALAIQFSSAF